MPRKIRELEADSLLVGELPEGCQRCTKGSKMVLFVTGLCDSHCFYCPLSAEKKNHDVIFADEMPVRNESDILYEIDAIGARGAGISGGDPLCKFDRTTRYIRLMREETGSDFHIHLYTAKSDISVDYLAQLNSAGLDEIRFHPQSDDWSGIHSALELDWRVGIEVPAIPNDEETLISIAQRAEECGVNFLNINELEASESNFSNLVGLGFRLTSLDAASIEGSESTAIEVLSWGAANLDSLTLHYCSARFKDSVQMRNRLERRLKRTIRPFEERAEDEPLLVLGIIRAKHGSHLSSVQLQSIWDTLIDDYEVPTDLTNLDIARDRIEIAPWILIELADELGDELAEQADDFEIGIAYEYPSFDRLQTQFMPL
ncbi:MAG: radical SAM protein [Candidatus Thorarchaeota archaeon]|nr:radical SAM protein [Candidatus Thorarchaeota archaeon]